MPASSERITLATLRQTLRSVEPAALLVEPRILRRVIRLDRRLPGLGLSVPHRKSYTIRRERLLAFVDRTELELSPAADLPRTVILLAKPSDEETLDLIPADEALRRYWRLLLHARTHIELEKRLAEHPWPGELAAERHRQIGAGEFAEIRSVLVKDDFLFAEPSDLETYIEFVAVYVELQSFAPQELPLYFPSVRNWEAIDRLVQQDVPYVALLESTRLSPDLAIERLDSEARLASPKASSPAENFEWTPRVEARLRRLQARAERAAALGNSVKAAILHTRAAWLAPPLQAARSREAALEEIKRLARRLRPVLQLSSQEADAWRPALAPLLEPAADGFWTGEARLLYDLQKVCVEHERGVFKLDLLDWALRLGRRPLRRPLPLLREALIAKHLRTADRRLISARMPGDARERLTELLAAASKRVELRSRERLRPLIAQVFDEVGFAPKNVPEQVARRKLIEELIDRTVEHGFFNMGVLRDAISKNDLKLPDVTGLGELAWGDQLLRADRKLADALDGVYRPGAIYLRWPQRLSSLAFGTDFGRFLTQYVAVPFGGAYLALAFVWHVAAWFTGNHEAHANGSGKPAESHTHTLELDWPFLGIVFLFGVWLSLMIHRPAFRAWNIERVKDLWQFCKQLLVDLPTRFVRSPLVQRILHSQTYAAVRNYLLRPAWITLLLCLPWWILQGRFSPRLALDIFLGVNLFLNSPIGRFAEEWITDFFVRAWHELTIKVLATAFHAVMDVFRSLVVALERVVYTVDEWLRFRAGDNRLSQAVKLVAGAGWAFVSYFIVFVFTLLVEPQINPIKHFPVVTVAHKLIFSTAPFFTGQLEPFFGLAKARTIVWSTIWLIPGVFGFLVWELKENWRLYAANRPKKLRPVPIGHHGETMLGLLRPGFHSGTLPKLFARLRTAARKAEKTKDWKPVHHKRTEVQRVEDETRRFVERDLLGLLEEAGFPTSSRLTVGEVHAGTNRIDVELRRDGRADDAAWLTWEDHPPRLQGAVNRPGWIASLSGEDRQMWDQALVGLFQRAAVDAARDRIDWNYWVAWWTPTLPGNPEPDRSKPRGYVPSGLSEPAASAPAPAQRD